MRHLQSVFLLSSLLCLVALCLPLPIAAQAKGPLQSQDEKLDQLLLDTGAALSSLQDLEDELGEAALAIDEVGETVEAIETRLGETARLVVGEASLVTTANSASILNLDLLLGLPPFAAMKRYSLSVNGPNAIPPASGFLSVRPGVLSTSANGPSSFPFILVNEPLPFEGGSFQFVGTNAIVRVDRFDDDAGVQTVRVNVMAELLP